MFIATYRKRVLVFTSTSCGYVRHTDIYIYIYIYVKHGLDPAFMNINMSHEAR